MKNTKNISKILFVIIQVVVGIIIVASLVLLPFTPNDEGRSRLIFNAAMAFVLLVLTLIPSIMEKTWKIDIPPFMETIFLFFSTLAFLFGEIFDFYLTFKWWDSMLHFLTGAAIACGGFTIINYYNTSNNSKSLSQMGAKFACVFVICFTLACGTIWEIVEFIADTINGTNMQRYMDSITNEVYIGRNALLDTMKDLVLDFLGGLILTILGYIDIIKHNGRLIGKLNVQKKD